MIQEGQKLGVKIDLRLLPGIESDVESQLSESSDEYNTRGASCPGEDRWRGPGTGMTGKSPVNRRFFGGIMACMIGFTR